MRDCQTGYSFFNEGLLKGITTTGYIFLLYDDNKGIPYVFSQAAKVRVRLKSLTAIKKISIS